MSLVGSLEDLGLGDILQIVSLSRKSGLLLIHSEEGEGRIVFCDGLVRAAYVKGEPENLRSLLVEAEFITAEEFDRVAELAGARGVPVEETLPECTSLTPESLDSLSREQVERAVFHIFSWVVGEFSFEVRDEIEERDREILISMGINAQYLTMEATRLSDEGGGGFGDAETGAPGNAAELSEADDEPIFFSGEEDSSSSPSPGAGEGVGPTGAVEPETAPMAPDWGGDAVSAEEVVALAATRSEAPELEGEVPAAVLIEESPAVAPVDESPPVTPIGESPAVAPVDRNVTAAPVEESPDKADTSQQSVGFAGLISIDPNLSSLEWQKLNLAACFSRVHIFQNGESGIARIRQYLRRGEIPVVLVSIDLAIERVSGVDSLSEFILRLKLLAPCMPVLVVRYDAARSEESIDAADAIVTAPDPAALINRKVWSKLTEEADRFRSELSAWLKQPAQQASGADRGKTSSSASESSDSERLRTLRAVSEQIRDPANHGEVLKLVLRFAAESLSRVAMFMVRDETAVGVAQIGLPRGGGPDDIQFREIEFSAAEVGWFKTVLETRSSLCSPATGDGDRELARQIGDREPAQAYVAPISSGGRVVALLYADNLPGEEPVGDTAVIEIALHEAGLALERVLLERALAQIGDPSAP